MSVGEVTINDLPSKSNLYRFCEKKIDQWIRSHAVEDAQVEFKVAFTEEAEKEVSCITEIQIPGGKIWRGCELAGDANRAFLHSLKRLQPH